MNMRTIVRCMWAIAVILGFSFVTYTQYEWAPVTVTNGHPLIAPPITMIVTYECGMITAILTTTFMFFLETFRFRELVPPLEEDIPSPERCASTFRRRAVPPSSTGPSAIPGTG